MMSNGDDNDFMSPFKSYDVIWKPFENNSPGAVCPGFSGHRQKRQAAVLKEIYCGFNCFKNSFPRPSLSPSYQAAASAVS
jgi:hypothetical protein